MVWQLIPLVFLVTDLSHMEPRDRQRPTPLCVYTLWGCDLFLPPMASRLAPRVSPNRRGVSRQNLQELIVFSSSSRLLGLFLLFVLGFLQSERNIGYDSNFMSQYGGRYSSFFFAGTVGTQSAMPTQRSPPYAPTFLYLYPPLR